MCNSAPTAQACWRDAQNFLPGLYYLGICGDYAHSVRQSGHNCAYSPGGNEDPIGGVDYAPGYCHALDIGHGGNRDKAVALRNALLADGRVRYVIDNRVGYYPPSRGGGTFQSSGHETHIHVSFMPGSTFNTRTYFNVTPPPPPIKWPLGKDDHGYIVLLLEIILVQCGYQHIYVDTRYGEQTQRASQAMQKFLKRGVRPQTSRNDFRAFTKWARFVRNHQTAGERILTLNDSGPLVTELRANLRVLGKDVSREGKYDPEVQSAVLGVQRYFDLDYQAGNCNPDDRKFIRLLADNQRKRRRR
jgi:peptidoglycan hydrolase-like protein with peptidoglycan-binding domain